MGIAQHVEGTVEVESGPLREIAVALKALVLQNKTDQGRMMQERAVVSHSHAQRQTLYWNLKSWAENREAKGLDAAPLRQAMEFLAEG